MAGPPYLTTADQFRCEICGAVLQCKQGQRVLRSDGMQILGECDVTDLPVECKRAIPPPKCVRIARIVLNRSGALRIAGEKPLAQDCILAADLGGVFRPQASDGMVHRGQTSRPSSTGPATSHPAASKGELEISFVAFIDERFGDWLPEPFTHIFQALCLSPDDHQGSVSGDVPDEMEECFTADFSTDRRRMEEFSASEGNGRLWIRVCIPVVPGEPFELSSAKATAECGSSHQRRHYLDGRSEEIQDVAKASLTTHRAAGGLQVKASAAYPFQPFAPSIDMELDLAASGVWEDGATLTLDAFHDRFPSYELYVGSIAFRLLDAVAAGETGPGYNLVAGGRDARWRPLLHERVRLTFQAGEFVVDNYSDQPPPETRLQDAFTAFLHEAEQFASSAIRDANVRRQYLQEASKLSAETLQKVGSGEWTMAEGVEQTTRLRNVLRQMQQLKSTDVGRAWARSVERTFNAAEKFDRLATSRFGRTFSNLSEAERDLVRLQVIVGAARTRPAVNRLVSGLGVMGRAFVVLSLSIAVYNIIHASDPRQQALYEVSTLASAAIGTRLIFAVGASLSAPAIPLALLAFAGGMVVAFVAGQVFDWLIYSDDTYVPEPGSITSPS